MTHPEITLSQVSLFLSANGGRRQTQKTLILLLISENQRSSASTPALAGGAREIKLGVNYVFCLTNSPYAPNRDSLSDTDQTESTNSKTSEIRFAKISEELLLYNPTHNGLQ